MADVSRFARSDRAQFILVSGLLIAVVLVALVLLLNATIYTENVATRGVDSGANDALQYQETLSVGLAGLVEEENEGEYSEWEEVETNVTRGTGILVERLGQQHVERGVIATADVRFDPGVRIWDEEGLNDDEIARDVTEVRSFTIDPEDLPEEEESLDIVVGENEWVLSLYDDGGVIAEVNGTSCEKESEEEIALQNSDWCDGEYEWAEDVEPGYDIQFVNGSTVNGEYELVASGEIGDDLQANHTAFVYGATIDLTYRSSQIEYSTNESLEWEAPR